MGPQTGSFLANVTGINRSQNRYICIFKMVHGSLLKAARVRFQHQLQCSWLCVNESQPAAKIMLHGPKKRIWGLLSTWLIFPVALRHILRDFNWVWSALRDWLFSLIIKMNLLKKCRQNQLYIWRFSESMRPIWWQSPSISKSPLGLWCSLYGS